MDYIKREYETILERRDAQAENSYTSYLFAQGIDKILKKVGEECTEVVIAAKNSGTCRRNFRPALPCFGDDGRARRIA